jgi:hypothetical protein
MAVKGAEFHSAWRRHGAAALYCHEPLYAVRVDSPLLLLRLSVFQRRSRKQGAAAGRARSAATSHARGAGPRVPAAGGVTSAKRVRSERSDAE